MLPKVLKRGIEITPTHEHKNRNYNTLTIAGPVAINGARGNMVVAVKQTKGNRYKVHRILTPDGQVFTAPDMANAERLTAGRVTDGSQASGAAHQPSNSASGVSVAEKAEGVNTKNSLKQDSAGRSLSEGQREFFKDSKAVDSDGNLLVLYHGTNAEFTVFDHTKGRSTMDIQGMFFSPWEIEAGGYGENTEAYYLSIKNPADESTAMKALQKFKGQNEAGKKARDYLIGLGYDGAFVGAETSDGVSEEYIAFYPEQIKRADNLNPTSDPDIRYSIKHTADNRPVVVVNDNILANAVNDKEVINAVKKSLGRFKRVPIAGQTIFFTGDIKHEYPGSKYTQWIKAHDPEKYTDKMRLAGHPQDIIYATTDYINEAPKHTRKDNIVDFARGKLLIDVDGRQYEAEVVIGFTSSGICELHDVVEMDPATFEYKKIEAEPPVVGMESNDSTRSGDTASGGTLSQPDGSVKHSLKGTDAIYEAFSAEKLGKIREDGLAITGNHAGTAFLFPANLLYWNKQ